MPTVFSGGPGSGIWSVSPSSHASATPGTPGPPGAGLELAGSVPTYADLPSGLGTADAGTAYMVLADNLLYTWSGTSWPAEGQGVEIKGEQGDPGRGVSDVSVSGNDLVFSMSDSTSESVTVPALSAAAASASAAASSASAADSSATAAAGSASAASGSQSAAAASAGNAASSASAAAGSALAASSSADAASTSASNAASSQTAAASSASAASSSATAASGSATAASGSASAASTSASNADASATAAAGSASAASSSATAAAGSASDASDSADAAAQSAADAAAVVTDGIPNATASVKGGVKLPGGADGELGGTWDHPTVTGWANKADLVGGKIPTSQIPAVATHEIVVVTSTAQRLALTSAEVQVGDTCVQTGNPDRGTYILNNADPSLTGSWTILTVPTEAVTSVNGYNGAVVLGKSDVGLGNVDNTSDANKPVSTATQTALNAKQPKVITGSTATASATAAKVVTAGSAPTAGDILALTLTSGNTAASITLDVNSAGAIATRAGGVAPVALSAYAGANGLLFFFFDGTYYHLIGTVRDTDTNTTYTVLSNAEVDAGSSSTARAISGAVAAYILSKAAPLVHTHSAADVSSGTLDVARIPVGTAAGTVAAGDDSRITGAVPSSRTVSAGTGLTGGGDLSANRSFAVSYGTTSGTACQGNDSRLSDARTPTAHAHAGTDITSGTVPYGRLPVGTAASTVAAGDDSRITGAVQSGDSRLTDARRSLGPTVESTASSSTPTPAISSANHQYNLTALAAGATFGAPTGSPVDGGVLMLRVKDNGTARSLAFNAVFRAVGVTLPTTTTVNKTMYIGCRYNTADSKWDVLAVGGET